jgi:hypothetical protein
MGRNTHWNSEFDGKKYRSSWEAIFQYFNPDAEYESLRILYSYKGKEFIYIVDFINHITKEVIEVKPKELLFDEKTKSKISALQKWADQNNYTLKIFNLDSIRLLPEPNYSQFSELTSKKIKKLYETLKN